MPLLSLYIQIPDSFQHADS